MSGVLSGNKVGKPSLWAKMLGLSGNGIKPALDGTSYTTAEGAAVVDMDKLLKDPAFQDSAKKVLDFLKEKVPDVPNGAKCAKHD